MQCPRCQGTMIVDEFVDMGTSGEIWMPGWRCMLCGEILDAVIERHRQQQKEHPEIADAVSGSAARPPSPLSLGSHRPPKRLR